MKRRLSSFFALLILLASSLAAQARIKDLATFEGVRENQLIGYGIVVGLEGTGDTIQNKFTFQAMANMLEKMGITVNPKEFQLRNVASVMVTAKLPPFARTGSQIDVTVSSIGSAKSIQGGVLLMTPLKGANGMVYAAAQGPVSIGGFNEGTGGGGKVRRNHSTVGTITSGATVEREIPFSFNQEGELTLVLLNPEFTTASRVAAQINKALAGNNASAMDSSSVRITVPKAFQNNASGLAALLENLPVEADSRAIIVMNERTGTVVMGGDVKVHRVAVAHGNLTVTVTPKMEVSQPLPLSQGETVAQDQTEVKVDEEKASFSLVEGATVGDVVKGLNAIGATPRDVIAILQAIKESGAIQAEVRLM